MPIISMQDYDDFFAGWTAKEAIRTVDYDELRSVLNREKTIVTSKVMSENKEERNIVEVKKHIRYIEYLPSMIEIAKHRLRLHQYDKRWYELLSFMVFNLCLTLLFVGGSAEYIAWKVPSLIEREMIRNFHKPLAISISIVTVMLIIGSCNVIAAIYKYTDNTILLENTVLMLETLKEKQHKD